jgi:uncharacterized protein
MTSPDSLSLLSFAQPPKLQPASVQPILLGGAGLAVTVYGLTHLSHWGDLLGGLGLLGVVLWGVRQLKRSRTEKPLVGPVTAAQAQEVIGEARLALEQLRSETAAVESMEHYGSTLDVIVQGLSRQVITAQIIGIKAVGKTSLHRLLAKQHSPMESSPWTIDDDRNGDLEALSTDSVLIPQTDVVLFVVQGDLTQLERNALQRLHDYGKRLLLILNKQDQYLPTQAEIVLAQLRQQVKSFIAPQDVVAISTCPQSIKVCRHQADGSAQESWEMPSPQLQPLLERMQSLAVQESSKLICQSVYQQVSALKTQIQVELNQLRRERALPLVERYQWVAAGTAFANPLPSLDMVATAAINGKLVQDLASLYRIPISLDSATDIATVLVKTLIQMGLVEASTQLLSAVLKGNVATYAVGGALQGVGAAYFTRMAGLSLIELFEVSPEMRGWSLDPAALKQIVQRLFQQHQRLDMLQEMAHQTLTRLRPAAPATIPAAQ